MSQRLGLKHRAAGFAWFLWSVLDVKTFSCPLEFRLVGTLSRAGNCSLVGIKLDPTDDTVFGRIFLLTPPIPPGNTADLAAGLGLPICLEHNLADHAGLG